MVKDYSRAEDSLLLPTTDKRGPGISNKFENAYRDERKPLYSLANGREVLRCACDGTECAPLVRKLHKLARTLREVTLPRLQGKELR